MSLFFSHLLKLQNYSLTLSYFFYPFFLATLSFLLHSSILPSSDLPGHPSGEDLERNDGSPSKPYYMPQGLHRILNKNDQRGKKYAVSWNCYLTGDVKNCGSTVARCIAPQQSKAFWDMESGADSIYRSDLLSAFSADTDWLLLYFFPIHFPFHFFLLIFCPSLPYTLFVFWSKVTELKSDDILVASYESKLFYIFIL